MRWSVTPLGLVAISGLTRLSDFGFRTIWRRAVRTLDTGTKATMLPQIIVDPLTLLFDIAIPAAIGTMALTGIAFRQKGGANFQAGAKS
jgi:hypothetical protein